jgi:1,4-alpha-glucan branching enzyme
VVANFANQAHEAYTVGLPGPGRWHVRFNSDWRGYDGEFLDFESFDLKPCPATPMATPGTATSAWPRMPY